MEGEDRFNVTEEDWGCGSHYSSDATKPAKIIPRPEGSLSKRPESRKKTAGYQGPKMAIMSQK